MASFFSFLGDFVVIMIIAAYIVFMGWVIGNAIECLIRQTIREEIREHDERRRRLQAEIEGK